MKYTRKLETGEFLKRYKRFFADIRWNGEIVVAHVPNTGSMKTTAEAGAACLFSISDNPERKLKYTLEMVQAPSGAWVGVNTATPNAIVKEAIEAALQEKKIFKKWQGYDAVKPEYKITPETRFDFMLSKNGTDKKHFIEVKNVTYASDGHAKFPDSVTERGRKHLRELMRLVDEGHTAEIVFTVQRADCERFTACDEIDPEYGKLLRQAQKKGVIITPLLVNLSDTEVILSEKLLSLHL
jgi:sugar fermentation stimulation protein A